MPRTTPAEARAQTRAQNALMKKKLMQKRAMQEHQAVKAQAQGQAAKAQAQSAAAKQKKKQLEAMLHADLTKMIYHMKTAQQHWLTAMKIFAAANDKIKAYGAQPMSTNFYKNLSYIDDVYEGMGMFINKAKETLKL